MTAKKLLFKNSRPLKYFIFSLISIVFAVMLTSCEQNPTAPNEPPKPPGYQEDIYWPSLADNPWPMFQHDPQYTGRSNYKGPQNGHIINEFTFNAITEYSGILLSKSDDIYFTFSNAQLPNGTAAFINKLNSQLILQWSIDISIGGSPEIAGKPILDADNNIYSGSYAGFLFSTKDNGVENWRYNAGEIIHCGFAGINIDKFGNLYFSTTRTLIAITKYGNKLFELPEFKSSPIVFAPDGNTIYAINESFSLDALGLDGDIIWSYPFSSSWSPIPFIDSEGNIYLSENDSTFISIDSNGKIRWKYFIQKDIGNSYYDFIDHYVASTLDKNGNIFFRTTNRIYSIDYFGKLRWVYDLPDAPGTNLLCDIEGTIYNGTWGEETGEASIYSISNSGLTNWQLSLGVGSKIRGSSLALSKDGKLLAIITDELSIPFYSRLIVVK